MLINERSDLQRHKTSQQLPHSAKKNRTPIHPQIVNLLHSLPVRHLSHNRRITPDWKNNCTSTYIAIYLMDAYTRSTLSHIAQHRPYGIESETHPSLAYPSTHHTIMFHVKIQSVCMFMPCPFPSVSRVSQTPSRDSLDKWHGYAVFVVRSTVLSIQIVQLLQTFQQTSVRCGLAPEQSVNQKIEH